MRAQEMEAEATRIVRESIDAHHRLLAQSIDDLARVAAVLRGTLQSGGKVLLFGNGGSAADAQHVAAELVGRFLRNREPWPAIALTTDTSILTAVANDFAYEEVFARQVTALGRVGDLAVGISTSGRSPNVLKGLEAARAKGCSTLGVTGADPGELVGRCDHLLAVPASETPRIQELHLLAWHIICDLTERAMVGAS